MTRVPAAEFRDVSKVYADGLFGQRVIRALDKVSLKIETGEVFGLVGPNRAGKTTLVKCLLSICHPTSGDIRRLGRPWSDRRTLARVGYVHENQAFPRYLTAEKLLEYYGALSGVKPRVARERGTKLLEKFSLADRRREPISRFSKGMLQRLALAQALINEPELLVLDEPSEGMDIHARRQLREVIFEQRRQGGTTIIVSHALTEIQLLCDRVAVLGGGRIVRLAKTSDLTEGARNERGRDKSLEEALAPIYAESCN